MRQVVTELDLYVAMCDYMIEQLTGRFSVQFPEHTEVAAHMSQQLQNPHMRESVPEILSTIEGTVSYFGMTVTKCTLRGCTNEENHEFIREFLDLVWDARDLTNEWLRGKGIVPGQSAN